jgi:hypothetical protein
MSIERPGDSSPDFVFNPEGSEPPADGIAAVPAAAFAPETIGASGDDEQLSQAAEPGARPAEGLDGDDEPKTGTFDVDTLAARLRALAASSPNITGLSGQPRRRPNPPIPEDLTETFEPAAAPPPAEQAVPEREEPEREEPRIKEPAERPDSKKHADAAAIVAASMERSDADTPRAAAVADTTRPANPRETGEVPAPKEKDARMAEVSEPADTARRADQIDRNKGPEQRPARRPDQGPAAPERPSVAAGAVARRAENGRPDTTKSKPEPESTTGSGQKDAGDYLGRPYAVAEEHRGRQSPLALLSAVRPRGTQPRTAQAAPAADEAIWEPIRVRSAGEHTELPGYKLGGGYVRGMFGNALPLLDRDPDAITTVVDGRTGNVLVTLQQPLPDILPDGGIRVLVDTTKRRATAKVAREVRSGLTETLEASGLDDDIQQDVISDVFTVRFEDPARHRSRSLAPAAWLSQHELESTAGMQAMPRRSAVVMGRSDRPVTAATVKTVREIHLGYKSLTLPDAAFAECVLEDVTGEQVVLQHPSLEAMLGRLNEYELLNRKERAASALNTDRYIEAMHRIGLGQYANLGEAWARALIQNVQEGYSLRPGEVSQHLLTDSLPNMVTRVVGRTSRTFLLAVNNFGVPFDALTGVARRTSLAIERRNADRPGDDSNN